MQRQILILIGVLALAGFAFGFTQIALSDNRTTAISSAGQLVHLRSRHLFHPASTPTPSAKPTPRPYTRAATGTAVTNRDVRLRAGASTASADLVDVPAGTAVSLTGPIQALWQPVNYRGTAGFIYSPYLNY